MGRPWWVRVIKYAEPEPEDREKILGKKSPSGLLAFQKVLKTEKADIVHFHELAPGRGINIYHVQKAKQLNFPVVLTFHQAFYTCFKGSLIYENRIKCDGKIDIAKCTRCIYNEKGIKGFRNTILSKLSMSFYSLGVNLTNINHSTGTALAMPFIVDKMQADLARLSSLAEKIIVLSEWYKEVLKRNDIPAEKIEFIKQSINRDHSPKQVCQNIASPSLKLVYLGRISKAKGLHILLKAIVDLPVKNINLYIYGPVAEDGYFEECQDLVADRQNVNWMGVIDPAFVKNELAKYDILCIPSDFEMNPLVIQEAFTTGLAILASDVYGNAEQIRDGVNGWLFDFRNFSHLAAILKRLINNPAEVQKIKERNQGSTHQSTNIAFAHKVLYQKALENKKH